MKSGASLIATTAHHVHSDQPLITFPTTGGGSWEVWYRFLALRGVSVFEIGNVCGTCEFWFRRLDTAQDPVDIPDIQERLSSGLEKLDDQVVAAFERLLQSGTYRISLLQLTPELVHPGSAADYFTNEQPATWVDRNIEGPNEPGISYYRVIERSGVNADGDLAFEFIAPLQAVDSLSEERIAYFEEALSTGGLPTAVAVGVLDIKQYYDSATAHWCLTHYLLDGHHKVAAAARSGFPLTLLSFIASEHGVSAPDQIDQLLANYPTAVAA